MEFRSDVATELVGDPAPTGRHAHSGEIRMTYIDLDQPGGIR